LRAHEDRIQDIGWIILSHQHIDRWGLARTVVGRSGAEVCALAGLEVWLRRYPASLAAEDAFAAELLRRHGRSGAVGGSAVMGGAHHGAPVVVDRALNDGDLLEFADRQLHVLHRPGHSPSDPSSTTRSTRSSSAPIM